MLSQNGCKATDNFRIKQKEKPKLVKNKRSFRFKTLYIYISTH
ncbi:hypothetical protein EVA_03393 [gut metagenome]|uniref:Uncharacterized protein n=1 Tax=gut metagenome TaxID=749906 RepID=J9GLZ1_9ZZZZ